MSCGERKDVMVEVLDSKTGRSLGEYYVVLYFIHFDAGTGKPTDVIVYTTNEENAKGETPVHCSEFDRESFECDLRRGNAPKIVRKPIENPEIFGEVMFHLQGL